MQGNVRVSQEPVAPAQAPGADVWGGPQPPIPGPGGLPITHRPVLPGATPSRTLPTVELLRTELAGDWDEYVAHHRLGTIFHSAAWRNAVVEAFELEALYLIVRRAGMMCGCLPLFLVPSRISGRMLVSVPFSVGGGILADDEDSRDMLVVHAIELAREHRCGLIDLRSEQAGIPGLPIIRRYLGFERALPDRPEDVPGWLPRKARAVVRRAIERYRLTIQFGDEHLSTVWRMYARNMRRLASLAYPFSFFQALAGHTPGGHWICVVEYDGRPVAGLVTFLHRDRVLPYFFGAMASARRLGAANFAYFRVMQRAVDEGFRLFDFGRSRADNQGSVDFKRFQGFEPHALEYQVLKLSAGGRTASPSDNVFRAARCIWPYLPVRLTNLLSARLSRHLPG